MISGQMYSPKEQIAIYKNLMTSLTTEKEGVTEEIKKQRQEKTYQIAKGLLTIDGDDQFKTKIDSYLQAITSVKPGRKLIKALAKTKCNIKVKPDDQFHFVHHNDKI